MTPSRQIDGNAKHSAAEATLAKALAPEEIRPGDFVTLLHVVAEVPSYFWYHEAWTMPADQPVRIRFVPASDGAPLKVKSICLPFVLAKQPCGTTVTLDLRKHCLARLDPKYGKRAWKEYKKAQASKPAKSRK